MNIKSLMEQVRDLEYGAITFQKYKQNLKVVIDKSTGDEIICSYNTPLVRLSANGDVLAVYRDYDYSTTTVKHLNYALQCRRAKVKNRVELEKLENFWELRRKGDDE